MMRETRTERDLVEALAALERYAPDTDAVLRVVQAGRRGVHRRRLAAWRRGPRLILLAGAVAAVAALAIALLPGAGPGRIPRPAPSGLPAATFIAKAMLTAFDSASGDVEYETQTGIVRGAIVDMYRTWSWPAQPVPGQRQVGRTLFSGTSPGRPAVKLIEDRQVTFVTPADAGPVLGQVTIVCFRGSGQTGCGDGDVNTPAGTWSRFTALVSSTSDVGARGIFNPAALVRGIASGAWRVVARTRLDGQQAIELSETGRGTDLIEPLPTLLWVNAQTYLPMRLVGGTASTEMGVSNFSYLPATPANLALLQPPVPAGYPRSNPEGS
jgi:hypothetical protein